MSPVRARYITPPLTYVAQFDRPDRPDEHQRAGSKQLARRAGVILWTRRPLGEGNMPGCRDKRAEFSISHRRPINPETVHPDRMRRRLLRIVVIGTHAVKP